MGRPKLDRAGQRFGRLTIVEATDQRSSRGEIRWLCRCDCGKETIITPGDLIKKYGPTKSCGCLRKELVPPHYSGKDNPNWNFNKTNEERRSDRKYPKYNEWRIKVFERDNYTCQHCGDSKGGNLVAHHLNSYTNNVKQRTLLENGITLCETCHKDFHHQYGYRDNTIEQYKEFSNGK